MMKFDKNSKINYPYNTAVNNFSPTIPASKEDWTNKVYDELKAKIKEHYSIVQNDKCAYCREEIRFDGYGEAIEHIIPKSKKYKFMFHPENLCLACYGCNTKKGTKNPLINDLSTYGDEYNDFPNKKTDYKIIHPHYDSFSHYIETKDFIFIPRNNQPKGEETIKMCQLNRFDLLYKRIRKKNNKKSMITLLMNFIKNGTDKNEVKFAQDFLQKIIERYNYEKKLKS